jgi:hypothetical protein
MPNRLVSVGDDFTLPPAVKAADENLPARLQPTALNATYAGKAEVAGKADAANVAKQAFPLRNVVVEPRGTDPIPCGAFGGYIWGTSNANPATIFRSSDGGETWATIAANVPVTGVQGIQRLIPTDDGQVLAFGTSSVVRSTGWGTGSIGWTTVLTNPTTSYFYPWSCDGDGTKFIVTHYASQAQGFLGSRYGWISLDGGLTWTVKWDTEARVGAATSALTHIHAAAYDPWEDRFFICEGHDIATGVFVSDDDGTTWTRLAYGPEFDADPANAPTVCVPTDEGVVFGSDDSHNGVYVLPRGEDEIDYAWAWGGMTNTQLLGYAHQGFRDPDTGLVYIVYVSDETDLPAPVAASDGRVAGQVWTEPGIFGMWRRIAIQDGHVCMWEQLGDQTAKGRTGGIGQIPAHKLDSGRVLGGKVTGGRTSLAVGTEAKAIGDFSVAVGGGAATTTHNGTAVGANAKVIGTGTSVGSGTASDATGTAVGYLASTTGGTSVGASALTASVSTTAIGRGARAATDAGAANINSTAVGRDAKANAASGNATAIGQGTTASGARSVAAGSGATTSGVDSVAVGDAASATAQFGVALGKSAVAGHTGSVALGANNSTTANDQVKVGAKHMEYAELAADPLAPAANNARVYFKDNGAGKTQMCVRFNTGAVIVLATEP